MNKAEITSGWLLISRDADKDPSVWFIFYHEDEGAAAVNLTEEHPRIAYKGFEAALKAEDIKPETEKIVLLGGPERSDDALLILHDSAAATNESVRLNEDFSFLPYTYVLVPGKPPVFTNADNKPGVINLKNRADFLVIMGYRQWESDAIEREIADGKWICLPAAKEMIFGTPHDARRAKILKRLN